MLHLLIMGMLKERGNQRKLFCSNEGCGQIGGQKHAVSTEVPTLVGDDWLTVRD